MSLISVKATYDKENRRFRINDSTPFSELTCRLKQTFPSLSPNFVLCYQDNESDNVTIDSEDEWQTAIELHVQYHIPLLRLQVRDAKPNDRTYCSIATHGTVFEEKEPVSSTKATVSIDVQTTMCTSSTNPLTRDSEMLPESIVVSTSSSANQSTSSESATILPSNIRTALSALDDVYAFVPYAMFVNDVTVRDGETVPAGSSFVKIWRLKNQGKIQWPAGCQLVSLNKELIQQFQAPLAVSLPCTAPGQTIDLGLNMIAPSQPGSYKIYFKLQTNNGTYFGPKLWIDIVVTAEPHDEPQQQSRMYQTPSALEQLFNMGFTDREANIAALQRNNGNLTDAIHDLLMTDTLYR